LKLKRDPEKPTRPPSAWIHFLTDFRKQNMDKGYKPKEVMQVASGHWKSLSDKSQYEQLAAKDKAVYEKARDTYNSTGAAEAWKRPPGKPKKPLTAFLRFATECRTEGQKATETVKAASAKWKSMSAAEKAPYEKQYEEEKVKYTAALEEYKQTGNEELWREKVGINAGLAKKAAAKAKATAAEATEKAKEKRQIALLKTRAAKQALKDAKAATKAAQGKAPKESKLVIRAKASLAKSKAKAAAAKAAVLSAASKAHAKAKVKAAKSMA